MFRRRSAKKQVFSRQFSGLNEVSVPGSSTGGTLVSAFGDAAILNYQDLLNSASVLATAPNFPSIVKGLQVLGISWSSDYLLVNGGATNQQTVFGAEALYINRAFNDGSVIAPAFGLTTNAGTFLDVNQLLTFWDPSAFPDRVLHRRRYSIYAAEIPTAVTAGQLTPGFGTERHIRRPFTLKPTEALFWRTEIYNFANAPEGTTDVLFGDMLAVISFRVLT